MNCAADDERVLISAGIAAEQEQSQHQDAAGYSG